MIKIVKVIKWGDDARDWQPEEKRGMEFNAPIDDKKRVVNYAFVKEKGKHDLEIITTILGKGANNQEKHTHDYIQEIYYILEGKVEFYHETNHETLRPGDIIIFDPEKDTESWENAHEIKNGDERSVVLTIKRVTKDAKSLILSKDKREYKDKN